MKIGLFGGSFDPVHQGHVHLARQALSRFALDRVIWIPAYFSPFKKQSDMTASAPQRLQMVKLVCAGASEFEVSDIEIRREAPSYAIDTVRTMRARYPQDSFYWILGQDAFEGVPRWREFETLSKEVVFLVGGRAGRTIDFQVFPGRAERIEMELNPAASSDLKKSLPLGEGWDHLHPDVRDYIRVNQLYGVKA